MKINKKLVVSSVVVLMSITPITAFVSNKQVIVKATKNSLHTITLNSYTSLVSKRGKTIKRTGEKKVTLKYLGKPVKIKNQYYYRVGNNTYAPTSQANAMNSKNVLMLNHNSYIYNKNGKSTKKLISKGSLLNFTNKFRKNNNAKSLYFYQGKWDKYFQEKPNKEELKVNKIKGKKYLNVSKNQFIKVNNVDSINSHPLYFNETIATVKRKAPQLFLAPIDNGLTTGKYYQKGKTLTVDELGGVNIGTNGLPNAYHIKGTDHYIWASDVNVRHNLESIDYGSRDEAILAVRTRNVPVYNFEAQTSMPSYYITGNSSNNTFSADGKIYLWNSRENKAELYYHLTNQYQTMEDLKNSPHFPDVIRTQTMDLNQNVFVKASDVYYINGKYLNPINTPTQAKDNDKIVASEIERIELKELTNEKILLKKLKNINYQVLISVIIMIKQLFNQKKLLIKENYLQHRLNT